MYEEHTVFEKPENEDARIWRYMDFTKFISLLDKQALFFSRADKLSDQFEGSYSKQNINLRHKVYEGKIPPHKLEEMSTFYRKLLNFTFVSCWHLNEYESAALWRLYLKSDEGMAVQSTFKLLKDSLNNENRSIFIGKVKYIDYEKDWLPEGNTFYPFVHKRKSFEHERELRAIMQEFSHTKGNKLNLSKSPFDDGLYVPADLDTLVDNIYLSPTCPNWLVELVKSVTKKYGLNKPINQSALDAKPLY